MGGEKQDVLQIAKATTPASTVQKIEQQPFRYQESTDNSQDISIYTMCK